MVIFIPFVLEAVALLTAFIRPNHIGELCSWGLIHLLPYYNFNYFGYKTYIFFKIYILCFAIRHKRDFFTK
ncbi:MAG TPA: hypothetical protein DEV85_13060 [Vibrio sp.]|nr:hypothetical protein [Vibrio sp.]